MTLSREEIQTIETDAAENWKDDLTLAAAAYVHGAGIVKKAGSQVREWFGHSQINEVVGLINDARETRKSEEEENARRAVV